MSSDFQVRREQHLLLASDVLETPALGGGYNGSDHAYRGPGALTITLDK